MADTGRFQYNSPTLRPARRRFFPKDCIMTLEQFWLRCLHHLHNTLPAKQYQSWIAPLGVGEGAHGEWIVYAPNMFALNMLRNHYAPEILRLLAEWQPENPPALLLQKGQGQQYSLATDSAAASPSNTNTPSPAPAQRSATDIVAARLKQLGQQPEQPAGTDTPAPAKSKPSPAKQPATERPVTQHYEQSHLSSDYTFDTLVEGKGNRLAMAAGQAIAEAPGKNQYNPFFLYGSTGLGKTHLVQAIGNRLLENNPRAKIRYMHADDYVRSLMKAFQNQAYDTFKQQYKQYDLLIIDDIQFIKGKDRTMEEFFYLYNYFHRSKKQIILTCDVLPTQIETLDDRLKSRFSWGLTLELEPPELEMRVQILQKKAAMAHARLDEQAAFFIANHVRSNVRELEGAFNRVLARSQFTGKPIDSTLAAEALKDIVASNHKPITPELIIATVAKYYGIKESDLLGKKRMQNIVRPRQLAITLAKELTDLSLSAIGQSFGKRDHSTVINAIEKAGQLRASNPDIDKDYEKLLILIKN